MTAATCTRHTHRSHQEVLWGKVLAYTSALSSHSLKLRLPHWLFWNFLSCLRSLWHDWRHPLVQQAANSSHCPQGCEKLCSSACFLLFYKTSDIWCLDNPSFGFFKCTCRRRPGGQISPAVKSVQEFKITENWCPMGMPIHHCKYPRCVRLHLPLREQMWM